MAVTVPTQAQLHDEVDRIYHERHADAPYRLDPDDPDHRPYVDIWLEIRDDVVNEWANTVFFEYFPHAGKLDPNDPNDANLIEYWLDIRDQIRDDASPRFDLNAIVAGQATSGDDEGAIRLTWAQVLAQDAVRLTFEGHDPTQDQAEWFLYPDGVPDGAEVTRSGILRYDLTGLTSANRKLLREGVEKMVETAFMFVNTKTQDQATADWERDQQAYEDALDTVNPDLGMTWREIRGYADGWHEVNNNFVWKGMEGSEWSIQTHPYFDDEQLNADMRYFLNQGQSVRAALLSVERNWRDVSRMLVMRLMAGAF
jgi:hypothetical protein